MSIRKSIVSALLIATAVPAAVAQDASSQKALQKAQFMLRQATAEKAALQAQMDALQQQLDKLSQQLATAKTVSVDDRRKLEQKLGDALQQCKAHGDRLSEQLAAGSDQSKREAAERTRLEDRLKKASDSFALCHDNNKKLYSINRELLERYKDKGFADVFAQREPFTGLKQVDIENLVQDYQYQIDELKTKDDVDSINEPGGRVVTP